MKDALLFFAFMGLFLGCKPKEVDPSAPTPNPSGEWLQANGGAGGYNNFESFKNFQYTFEVAGNNQPVTIRLTSNDINVQFALFSPNGTKSDVQGNKRDVSGQYTLNAGVYTVVVAAERGAVGRFSLALTGTKNGASLIPSQIVSSGTQNWGDLGGGGRNLSYRNHLYDFEVTEDNTSFDVELESADTDVALYIYNPLGQQVGTLQTGRYAPYIVGANKGTYTVMAATNVRGGKGNYNLRITGKVANLKRRNSQTSSLTGRWPDNKATDTYSVQLTANSSPLDIELTSPDTKAYMELQTNTGNYIRNASSANTLVIVQQNVAKNTYQIQVYPLRISGDPGSYTLTVAGQFADFKKL
jgi:hypothetical protein